MTDDCTETASVNFPAQGELLALPPGHEVDETCEHSITTMEDT
jgi:hypothetical protein